MRVLVRCCRGSVMLLPALCSMLCLCNARFAVAQTDSDAGDGRHWALLIGVQNYQHVTPLADTINDVEQLARTLESRGGFRIRAFVESAGAEYQPVSERLLAGIPAWLKNAGPKDHVLIYFTGHGFRDDEGRLYLAPQDFSLDDPAGTGLPIAWLREQIAACRAEAKLLVLDACHAGADKAGKRDTAVPDETPPLSLSAKDLAEPFERAAGVITLASSMGDQLSWMWPEKRQSLFTYWLDQGLKGHADRDGDGAVTIDELYQYLSDNVPPVARRRFSREQTPARIIGPDAPGVSVVIRPRPNTLDELLDDMADKIATVLLLRESKVVGVPEFAIDAKRAELELRADFGLLGRWCATELAGRLANHSAGEFEVVEHDALQEALRAKGLRPDALRTRAVRDLKAGDTPVPVLVSGILRNRSGAKITLQSELLGTERQTRLGSAGGAALLNESEWAMLGSSAAVGVEDPVNRPPEPVIIASLDTSAQGSHPLSDPAFPYRVEIVVGGRRRLPVFRGNDCFVPLSRGEVYRIDIRNNSSQKVFMRLLVDGLNTLPERPAPKITLVGGSHLASDEFQAGVRVGLDRARHWSLDPNRPYAVEGFFSRTGPEALFREFLVTDAVDSLAARQQYTDQIGLITAAFYAPAPVGARGLGTDFGRERQTFVREPPFTPVGDLLAVVHLRYVPPDALPR